MLTEWIDAKTSLTFAGTLGELLLVQPRRLGVRIALTLRWRTPRVPTMSADWLRQHEADSIKHGGP